MASVTISKLYIHSASDFSDYLELSVSGITPDLQKHVTHAEYAGGRVRVKTRPGQRFRVGYDLPFLTRAEREALTERAGQAVMVRDPVGHKFFAVMPDLSGDFFRARTDSKASVTFEEYTSTEEV